MILNTRAGQFGESPCGMITHIWLMPEDGRTEWTLIKVVIVIASLVEGAKRATGVVAVIDVFRAFTSAAVALANGASRIVMVRSVEEALELRQAGLGQFCIGEVGGRAPEGFDFGNSPFEIASVDFQRNTVIHRICIQRTWTSPSMSTATISPFESKSKKVTRSPGWSIWPERNACSTTKIRSHMLRRGGRRGPRAWPRFELSMPKRWHRLAAPSI